MKVTLVTYTANPDETAERAGRVCYSYLPMTDIESKNPEKFLKNIVKSGHTSILEHISFTFSIEGLSRVASHQLVRHRIGFSFSQESLRYVDLSLDEGRASFKIPESILNNEEICRKYSATFSNCYSAYREMIENGIPPEDARYILPMAVTSNIVVTANARALLHFFQLRCCNRTQTELRQLADEMLKQCKQVAPCIFANAGPNCVTDKCREDKPCGHPRNFDG